MRRRVLRILLNAATVLSLVLCVATVAAWVRSYLACDNIYMSLANPRLQLAVDTYRGVLLVAVISNVGTEDWLMPLGVAWDRSKPEGYLEARRSPTTLFNRVGFALDNVRYQTCQLRGFACPYWFITLLTAILPAARLVGCWRRARRLRMRPGICQYCGYDCRATPDRCPECGSRIAAAR